MQVERAAWQGEGVPARVLSALGRAVKALAEQGGGGKGGEGKGDGGKRGAAGGKERAGEGGSRPQEGAGKIQEGADGGSSEEVLREKRVHRAERMVLAARHLDPLMAVKM